MQLTRLHVIRGLWAVLCVLALTACERESPSAELAALTTLANDVCACKDPTCAEAVMTRWIGRVTQPPMVRPDEATAATALQDRINACLHTASAGSGSRPHRDMQLVLPQRPAPH